MTTTTMSLLFSSDPKNGAQPLDTTGSRFMVHLPQAIKFPQCKNIDLVLNTTWLLLYGTPANVSIIQPVLRMLYHPFKNVV